MKDYTITFRGRTNGAIGKFSAYSTHIKATNENEAYTKLYDNYEHIHNLTIKEDNTENKYSMKDVKFCN